jgi:integrase
MGRTFKTKSEARAWADAIEAQIAAGRYQPGDPDRTVGDVVDRYVATVAMKKKSGHRTTQQLFVWADLIGDIAIMALRPADIATARDTIARGRGPATVVRYLSALSHAFTVAVKDWQWCDLNPVSQIIWPREPRGRVRFLSEEERVALVTAATNSPCEALVSVVMLALLTGMRRGEILGLRWSNLDEKRRRIILTDTKNNERRQVPLVSLALKLVIGRRPHGYRPEHYIYHTTGNCDAPLNISHYWQQAVKTANLTDFRFHDLRHTAASYLAMTGATTNEIAEILGHKTLDMVKRYAHLTTSHSEKVLERMEHEIYSNQKQEVL